MSASNSPSSSSPVPVVISKPTESLPQWKLDLQAGEKVMAEKRAVAKLAASKPPAVGAVKPSGKGAVKPSGKGAPKPSAVKTAQVRYCRFEDHQHDRDTKTWNKVDGPMRMCPNKDCKFTHRVPRPVACKQDLECADYECKLLHSVQRPKPCRFGGDCLNSECHFNHPGDRREPCPAGSNCYEYVYEQSRGDDDQPGSGCELGHPRRMNRICRHDANCRMFNCQFLHHENARQDCPDGAQCQYQNGTHVKEEQLCNYKHPKYTRMLTDSSGNHHFS
jgi:hypothetical protein